MSVIMLIMYFLKFAIRNNFCNLSVAESPIFATVLIIAVLVWSNTLPSLCNRLNTRDIIYLMPLETKGHI